MARTKRDGLKRKCAQAINSITRAISDVADVYVEFKDVHPPHAQYLEVLITGLAKTREGLLTFIVDTWGIVEDDLPKWL